MPQFDPNSNTGSSSSISSQCNVDIYHEDIVHLFEEEGDSTTLEKYKRFKFAKENKTARECPHCSSLEIADYTISPKVKCSQCQHTFCYFHSNAHDFDKFPTCANIFTVSVLSIHILVPKVPNMKNLLKTIWRLVWPRFRKLASLARLVRCRSWNLVR